MRAVGFFIFVFLYLFLLKGNLAISSFILALCLSVFTCCVITLIEKIKIGVFFSAALFFLTMGLSLFLFRILLASLTELTMKDKGIYLFIRGELTAAGATNLLYDVLSVTGILLATVLFFRIMDPLTKHLRGGDRG